MRLIDGDALIQKANYEAAGMTEPFKSQIGVLVEWLVDKTPPIEPERKKGKWVDCHTTCSECGWQMIDDVTESPNMVGFNFCPNCGAKMEEPEDIPMEYFESGGR